MSHPNPERDECLVSTHEFKLHDWRWLAWPLSNTSARGRWCRLCGLTQGQPDGQCQTQNCLEYAAGGNDFCEFCQQSRTINDATTMRNLCVAKVGQVRKSHRVSNNQDYEYGFEAALDRVETALESLTLDQGEQEKSNE